MIEAQYPGTCPECGGRWQPGELIRGTDSRLPYEQRRRPTIWRHQICPDDVILDADHPVCPDCFLTHPTGKCDRS